jgi:hypothetical protein
LRTQHTHDFLPQCAIFGVGEEQLVESLEVLGRKGYFDCKVAASGDIVVLRVTVVGFGVYGRTFIRDYEGIARLVAGCFLNEGLTGSVEIAGKIRQPHLLVMHILEGLSTAAISSSLSLRVVTRMCGTSTLSCGGG